MSVPTPFYPVYDFRFNHNSKWKDSSGYVVSIVSVEAYGDDSEGLSDYCVTYEDKEFNTYETDAWCFQVCYTYCG